MSVKRSLLIFFLIFAFTITAFSYVEDRIDINRAKVRELMFLPGVDYDIAMKIIEYRKKNGGFSELEELVPIIGDIVYEKIRYDIMITEPEELAQGDLSGKWSISAARDTKYLDGTTPFNTSVRFDVGDTFSGYIELENYEIDDDKARKRDDSERSFTYNIYDIKRTDEEYKDVFEPQIFKKITADEQKQKYEDIIKKLEDKYGTRLSIKEDNKYITGYYESNPEVSEYFKHPDTKSKVKGKKEETVVNIDDRSEYNMQNKDSFKEEIEKKEKENEEEKQRKKRNIKRILRHQVDVGFMYLPYMKLSDFGSKGLGLSFKSFWDDNKLDVFSIENQYYDHRDPMYGLNFETELKDSKVGTVIYKLKSKDYHNEFDHFTIYGEKDIDRNTSIYAEYGQVFNLSSTYYLQSYSRYKKMNLKVSLKLERANCDDFSLLEPYSSSSVADSINPYVKIDYYLPKGNRVTLESELYKGQNYNSKGYFNESYSRYTSLTYRYDVSRNLFTEWYVRDKRKLRYGNINEYTTLSLYSKFDMGKTSNISIKIKKETDDERIGNEENSYDIRFYKKFWDTTVLKISTYEEDTPGPSFIREHEYEIEQDLSDRASLEYTHGKTIKRYSSGDRSEYSYSELSYELDF